MSSKVRVTISTEHEQIWAEATDYIDENGGNLSDVVSIALGEFLDRHRNKGRTPLELTVTSLTVQHVGSDDGSVALGATAEDSSERPYVIKMLLPAADFRSFMQELKRPLNITLKHKQ